MIGAGIPRFYPSSADGAAARCANQATNAVGFFIEVLLARVRHKRRECCTVAAVMFPKSRVDGVAGRCGVSRDDVVWCYRTLLRREPESEAVVKDQMVHESLRALVHAFVESREFQQMKGARAFHPIPLPTARIDVRLDQGQLAAAIAKVKAAWSHLGRVRPHYSVLTHEEYLPENLPRAIDMFWKTGEAEAARVFGVLEAHGVEAEGKTCIEYGCGVGRVTSGLAQRFQHVHAYDISPGHLGEAEKRIQSIGMQNVSLVLCSDSFLQDLQPCDVFYSRIVFQHNPPPLIDALVRAALRSLRPGGIAIFQVPTYAVGYSFDIDEWLQSPESLEMEMHCLPQPHIFQAIAEAKCLALEVREDGSTGDGRFISNTFVVRRPQAS